MSLTWSHSGTHDRGRKIRGRASKVLPATSDNLWQRRGGCFFKGHWKKSMGIIYRCVSIGHSLPGENVQYSEELCDSMVGLGKRPN